MKPLKLCWLLTIPFLLAVNAATAQQLKPRSAQTERYEEEEEEEGRRAIEYWNDLEAKIKHVNELNGIVAPNRQHFKVASWQEIKSRGQLNRTNGFSINGSWTQVYQSPSSVGMGRVETVAFSPTSANTFFLGTAGGGLWRTNDNGGTYFPVTDELPSGGITSIAINPTNANEMYVLTGSGLGGQSASSAGVFKSTNGGTSWFSTALTDTIGGTSPLYGYDLKMHPTDPNTLFCATNRGLYKTINGGDDWQLVLDGAFAGDPDSHEIFDIEFKPDDPSVVYASYYYRLYYSKNSGNSGSWVGSTTQYSGVPTGTGYNGFAASRICVSAASPNNVYIAAGVYGDDDYRTNNGGLFYVKATYNGAAVNAITYAAAKSISACSKKAQRSGGGRSYGEIYVSQSNQNNIIIGGVDFFSSTDGGSSWILKTQVCGGASLFHVDAGAKITVQGGYMYVATDGGIYRQLENYTASNAWSDITGGIEITQLYTHDGSPQDANYYLYANQDNGTHIRTSATSYQQFVGGDGTSCKFDKSNKNNFYGSVQNGEALWRSLSGTVTDITPGAGATNGDEKEYSGAFVFARCFFPSENNNNRLFAMKRSFYGSPDKGTTWSRVDIPGVQQPHVILKVAKSDENKMYAVETDWFDDSRVYHKQQFRYTINAGFNWPLRTANLPANIVISDLAIDAADANSIYITCYGNAPAKKVYHSTDGGVSWISLSAGLPNVDIRCIALANDAKKGIYVGTDLGVYYQDNVLNAWTRFSNGLPVVQIMNLYINPTLQNISAATFGRGIFVSDIYDPSACPASLTLNSIYFGHTIYAAANTINSAGIIYPGAENFITYSSNNFITLNPGFQAGTGSNFRAAMEGCSPTPVPFRTQPVKRAKPQKDDSKRSAFHTKKELKERREGGSKEEREREGRRERSNRD